MRQTDVRDDTHSRPGDLAERRDVAREPRAELEDDILGVGRSRQQRQRHARLVVEGEWARMDPMPGGQRTGDEVLRAGLAGRAGDSDDTGIRKRPPRRPPQPTKCSKRIVHPNDRGGRGHVDGGSPRDNRGRCSTSERVADEVVTVARRGQRHEAPAGLDDARVDGERRRHHMAVADQNVALGQARHFGGGQLHRDRSNSARATTRSSNGKVCSPIVCPDS